LNVRKEPLVFVGVVAFGALFVYAQDKPPRFPPPRGKNKDYVAASVPDVARSKAPEGRRVGFGRDLFSQPRDTSPLPPLGLASPPLEPLGALAPPTAWGPAPALQARFLRTEDPRAAVGLEGAAGVDLAPGLFDEPEEAPELGPAAQLDLDDPEQRGARIESFKRQYDWLYTNDFKFGQIRNADRHRLAARTTEPIDFFEIDPTTGQSKFRTESSVSYERARVTEFGFAATAINELELGRIEFGKALRPTDFERALRFAERCLEVRNEAPRGLELAEEMYQLLQAINTQQDPRPRLGLARCYELGFRFERAFETYNALLEETGGTSARVHAHLGRLRAMLRLDARAEVDFKRALDLARTDWEVRQLYGRFLMERARPEEALEQFKIAAENEPRGDDEVAARVRLRADYAGALLANGRPEEALERFTRALSADLEDTVGGAQIAVAGMGAAALLLGGQSGAAGTSGAGGTRPRSGASAGATPDAGFELLVTQGLAAMRSSEWQAARTSLELARGADPFRAHLALGALSFLAERTGHPEEAAQFIEEAFESNPVNAWVLYQRGRLRVAAGDPSGAEDNFRAALDRELDHGPALEALGALRNEAGDFEAAELYYERALGLDPSRAVIWSRRGFNHVQRGDLEAARQCFERAQIERPSLASAALGLAWCAYGTNQTQEALTLLALLEEDRRALGAEDPVRLFAKAQGDRIRDHESKESWRERFDREPGRIANDWRQEEGFGPDTLLRDGRVVLEGTFDRKGRTRVFRELPTERFLSFFGDLTVLPASANTVNGLFIAVERSVGSSEPQAQAEILIARGRDGQIQSKVRISANDDGEWKIAPAAPSWPVGEPVRVGIERVGDDTNSTFTVYVAGEPIFTGLRGDGIQRSRQNVRFGVFTEGDAGRQAALTLDDVEVIRRR